MGCCTGWLLCLGKWNEIRWINGLENIVQLFSLFLPVPNTSPNFRSERALIPLFFLRAQPRFFTILVLLFCAPHERSPSFKSAMDITLSHTTSNNHHSGAHSHSNGYFLKGVPSFGSPISPSVNLDFPGSSKCPIFQLDRNHVTSIVCLYQINNFIINPSWNSSIMTYPDWNPILIYWSILWTFRKTKNSEFSW